jgi:hypothetical protein
MISMSQINDLVPCLSLPLVKSLVSKLVLCSHCENIDLPSLDHELLDNTVESGALITETLLASSKSTIWLSANVHTAVKSPWIQRCLNILRWPSMLNQDRTRSDVFRRPYPRLQRPGSQFEVRFTIVCRVYRTGSSPQSWGPSCHKGR